MRLKSLSLLLLLLAITAQLQGQSLESPIQKHSILFPKKILLIGPGFTDLSKSFEAIQAKLPGYTFEDFSYASHKDLGSGYEMHLNLPKLKQYRVVFLHLYMGTFSNDFIKELAAYIKAGGKLFLLMDVNDRAYFPEKMEDNVNHLLKQLGLQDRVNLNSTISKNNNRTGVLKPLVSISRTKSINEDLQDPNLNLSHIERNLKTGLRSYLSSYGSGFDIKLISELSEASGIFQFTTENLSIVTNVFWSIDKGHFGIGTERISSAYQLEGSLESAQMLIDAMGIK